MKCFPKLDNDEKILIESKVGGWLLFTSLWGEIFFGFAIFVFIHTGVFFSFYGLSATVLFLFVLWAIYFHLSRKIWITDKHVILMENFKYYKYDYEYIEHLYALLIRYSECLYIKTIDGRNLRLANINAFEIEKLFLNLYPKAKISEETSLNYSLWHGIAIAIFMVVGIPLILIWMLIKS